MKFPITRYLSYPKQRALLFEEPDTQGLPQYLTGKINHVFEHQTA